jgi:ferredoxin
MKVSILTFSQTGNTKLIAKQVASKLTEGGHTVIRCNLLKLGKEMDSIGAANSPLLTQLRESLQGSEVVGLGAFSNFGHPSFRVNEIFEDAILPPSLFAQMKMFFTFGTAGALMFRTVNVLSTLLSDKNPSATFLGSLSVIAPENGAGFMPVRPYRDTWNRAELARVGQFAEQMLRYVNRSEPLPNARFSRATSWQFLTARQSISPALIQVVREKCRQCGTCARKCPYNACTLNSDIEDGFPIVNPAKCKGCGRCFQACPMEAIEVIGFHTELRSRYHKVNTLPAGEKCPDGAIAIDFPRGLPLMRRMLTGSERAFWIQVAVAVLLLAVLIAWFVRKH